MPPREAPPPPPEIIPPTPEVGGSVQRVLNPELRMQEERMQAEVINEKMLRFVPVGDDLTSQINFNLPNQMNNAYMVPNKTLLKLECEVVDENGTALDWTAEDLVAGDVTGAAQALKKKARWFGLVNNTMHSLFRDVDVKANQE